MSVAVRTRQGPGKFGVDSAQFEEIVAPRDERTAILKHASMSRMDKGSESEIHSNKEGNKNSKKKDSETYDYSDEDSYDDDFEESEAESPRKSVMKNAARKSTISKRSPSRTPETMRTKSLSVLSPRSNKKGKRKKRYKPYESPRSSSPATSRLPPEKNWGKPKNRSANVKVSRIDHSVVDRVLSANRHKVTKLESRLSQLIKELTKEKEENRTLRLIQHRQEKKLEKVIGEEAELPQLLVKHTAEVKSLRERLRKVQEVAHQKDEKLNEQNKVILKLRDKCKYYKDLCDNDELTEKAEMQKNLSQMQDNLKKRDEEISKLQRMLNLKDKTHSRNMKEQKEKLREAEGRLQRMEESCNNLQGKLRAREKQLDYTNIYQRQIILKEKTQMPLESPPRIAALPAPKRNKPKGKNSPKSNKATTGNKAKEINKKEDNKLVTAKDSDEESNKKPNSVFLTAQSDKESGSDKESMAIMNGESGGKAIVKSGLFEDESKENERRKRDEFEKSLREEDERLRKEKEEVERRLKEIQEREESEKVERETKWREDSARRARESEEKRQASARRQEEERRKEEERQMEERKREEDRQREEEKRREEERREQERREQERREQEKKSLPSEDSFFEDEESRRKKDALLARLKAMDSEKASDEDPLQFDNKAFPIYGGDEMSRPKASKGYEARSADKNLHNGLPAFPKESEVISPPESVKSDPDGVFGVPRGKPVLIGRGNLTKKNTNQFSWLDDSKKPVPNKTRAKPDNDFSFGDYSPSVSNNKKVSDGLDGDIFNTGMSRRPGRGRRREGGQRGDGFDFGTRRGSGGFNETKPQNNSLGFLSDDFGSKRLGENTSGLPSNNSPLLPRRRASQERNGPAVVSSVFDNLDDDIEEFTL